LFPVAEFRVVGDAHFLLVLEVVGKFRGVLVTLVGMAFQGAEFMTHTDEFSQW